MTWLQFEAPEFPQAGMPAPPFIVRIAGLPAESLAPFASSTCLVDLENQGQILDDLAKARSRLVAGLAEVLPLQPPELRRFLLAIKRDTFNGRSLSRFSSRLEWKEVDHLTSRLASTVLELERRLVEAEQGFAELYGRELEREHDHLCRLLGDERFLRGLALGSPELVSRARELLENADSLGRRAKKVEQSLLRFVTRTAAKLSPYSTLTTLGLGLLEEGIFEGFRFVPGSLREVSLVRANSSLLHQGREILMRHPRVRDLCLVTLNDTAHEVGPGRWQFLRNGRWAFDEEVAEFRFVPANFVRVDLSGPAIASIREFLTNGPLPFNTLVESLRKRHLENKNEESGCPFLILVNRLTALGFLCLLPPWRTSEVHVEKRMLETLRGLSPDAKDPTLKNLEAALEELVRLEGEYATTVRPEISSRELTSALDFVWEQINSTVGTGPIRKVSGSLYEDVFTVNPAGDSVVGAVIHLSDRTTRETLAYAELISRFACLFNHRYDVLHALAATWMERWPLRREMGFLELFQGFKDMWSRYLRFDLTERYDNFSSFDPLALPAMQALRKIRKAVREGTLALLEEGPDGVHLPPEGFASLLKAIPPHYRPLLGCSVFLQPADRQGRMWVLNRLFEGTGRYLSRYPAAMEEPMRSRFTSHLVARSSIEVDGEPADLLDLVFTQGSMANLRFPQTFRVLEMPGERLDLPASQRVHLSELRIEADLTTENFRLLDATGRRLIPVHLSSLNNLFVPVLLRFLSLFGPYEVRQVFPRARMETAGEVNISRRLICGNLVVRRARWEVPKKSLEGIANLSGSIAFRELQIWRKERELPQRAFVFEQMHHEGDPVQSFKPQYIDFSSPSLASLFLAIVRKSATGLLIEEALPIYSEFPPDPVGQQRAFEFQIESLALRTVSIEGPTLGTSERRRAYGSE